MQHDLLHKPQMVRLVTVLVLCLLVQLVFKLNAEVAWKYALSGQSPIEWTYSLFDSSLFLNDFVNTTSTFDKCFFLLIYPFMYLVSGFEPESLLRFMLSVEVLFTCLGFWLLTKAIVKQKTAWIVGMVIILASMSAARNMDLARFGYPYLGLYYHFLDMLRVVAIVAALKGRFVLSWVALGFAVITHPPLGMMGVACVSAMHLATLRTIPWRRFIVGVALFMGIGAIWYFLRFQSASITSGGISPELWFSYSRFSSFHWYAYSGLHWGYESPSFLFREGRFLSFVSFVILLGHYFRAVVPKGFQKPLAFGCASVAVMTVVGIASAAFDLSPLLIKVALARSTDLVILIGLPIVAAGVWQSLKLGNLLQAGLALLILVSPFFAITGGFPMVFTLGLLLANWHARSRNERGWVTPFAVLTTFVGLFVVAHVEGVNLWKDASFFGEFLYRKRQLLPIVGGLIGLALWTRARGTTYRHGLQLLGIAAIAYCAFVRNAERMGPEKVQIAENYIATQKWARANTEKEALFMVDPSLCYGWRTFSLRPSFGSVCDWIYVAWIYDAQIVHFNKGLARFNELGIDIEPYLKQQPMHSGHYPLLQRAKHVYHQMGDTDFERLSRKYGIRFFVQNKKIARGTHSLPVVYENDDFLILKAPSEFPKLTKHSP